MIQRTFTITNKRLEEVCTIILAYYSLKVTPEMIVEHVTTDTYMLIEISEGNYTDTAPRETIVHRIVNGVMGGDWEYPTNSASSRYTNNFWEKAGQCGLVPARPPRTCIVNGCTNKENEGAFRGKVCVPCYEKLVPEISLLNPIETAPKDGTWVLLFGPSGYSTTPLRSEVCRYAIEYRPRNPWQNHANDAFTDGGSSPTHWMPLPTQEKK